MKLIYMTLFATLSLGASGCGLTSRSSSEASRGSFLALAQPPPEFRRMDLPYYGAVVDRAGPGFMAVVVDSTDVDVLIERWSSALVAAGWTELVVGRRPPDRSFSAEYDVPPDRSGTMIIKPEGTRWTVFLYTRPRTSP